MRKPGSIVSLLVVVTLTGCSDSPTDECTPVVIEFNLQCSEVSDLENGEHFPAAESAEAGGLWWVSSIPLIDPVSGEVESNVSVSRLSEFGYEEVGLIDSSGDPVPLEIARETDNLLAIRAPETANLGDRYTLVLDGEETALKLEVAATTQAPLVISAEAGSPLPLNCTSTCYESDHNVPRSATIDVSWTGGPGVVEVVQVGPENTVLVQDFWLENTATERIQNFLVSMPVASGSDIDLTLEIRAYGLSDLTPSNVETLSIDSLPEISFENNGREICDPSKISCI